MSNLPLPQTFSTFFKLAGKINRSLFFDRSMDLYDEKGKMIEGGKETFLRSFQKEFKPGDDGELQAFLERREQTLKAVSARPIRKFAQTRLVVGLGLPHPIETGFLFDRMTGCPYLPGSSVKGLLRAAARQVGEGEMEGDRSFWSAETLDRIFGPELGKEIAPAAGAFVFYDAFPTSWPALAVDILTPHHGDYYLKGADKVPADWEQPVPVPFLTICEGTEFTFFVGPGSGRALDGDLDQLETLLGTALDWLGIGAKKSSGYGYFGAEKPPAPPPPPPAQAPTTQRNSRRPEPPPPPPPPPIKETLWSGAELRLSQGRPTAYRGKQQATCESRDLEPEVLEALRTNRRGLRAEVAVVKISGGDFRIDQVKSWKPL